MPFDSFMTAALTYELSQKLCGLKVDKVCQPERDEIDLLFRIPDRSKLIINCTASTPYMALSDQARENPAAPPMMCMLLRKHLSRAKITSVEQIGFDRIIRISFDSGDELGFFKSKYLYCEMMGRGSNLVFAMNRCLRWIALILFFVIKIFLLKNFLHYHLKAVLISFSKKTFWDLEN